MEQANWLVWSRLLRIPDFLVENNCGVCKLLVTDARRTVYLNQTRQALYFMITGRAFQQCIYIYSSAESPHNYQTVDESSQWKKAAHYLYDVKQFTVRWVTNKNNKSLWVYGVITLNSPHHINCVIWNGTQERLRNIPYTNEVCCSGAV
jgi:hypothetical protein